MIYDISLPISDGLAVWPRDPAVRITQPRHFDMGDHAVVSHLDLGAHTGTHVDAPRHFIPGAPTLNQIPLDRFVGPALVVHVPDADLLTCDVLASLSIPRGTERVLFRTRNSDYWAESTATFHEDFCAFDEGGARWLIAHGVRLVGIDYLSVAPFSNTGPTHRALLGAGVIPLEGLNLSGIEPGFYQLVCLPLRLDGLEGAPARAILIDQAL
ncbi:MAG: cyclase family protein [Anaerolineae bacterium]|nr:cyclase family protein [Anaerolineae bacterium]